MSDVIRATSDLHLTQRTAPYVFAALTELRADAQEHKGTTFIVGDILDQPHTVHMPTYLHLRMLLQFWPGRVIVIPGNHDQFGDGWEHALAPLMGGSCSVVSQPVWSRFGRILPYTKPDRFADELARVIGKPVGDTRGVLPFVWCHHGFRGAYRNAMNRDRDGVSTAEIPANHLVITGHYHMPQTLGRVVYCGSPYQTSFAEEGQAKGWLRWEDPTVNPLPVRVAYGDLGAPRHYTIEWDGSGPPKVPDGILPQDIVRVRTEMRRRDALGAAKQLHKAGLGGAPILARPDSSAQVEITSTSPREAAEEYVITMSDGTAPDPGDMRDFAEEEGLWSV